MRRPVPCGSQGAAVLHPSRYAGCVARDRQADDVGRGSPYFLLTRVGYFDETLQDDSPGAIIPAKTRSPLLKTPEF